MSLVMFRRALADLRWTVVWYALGLAVYAVLIMSFYPTVRENAQMTQQLMEAFPKAMMDAFGAADMASLSGFVGGKFLNVMWPIIVGVFVIMAGRLPWRGRWNAAPSSSCSRCRRAGRGSYWPSWRPCSWASWRWWL